MSARATHLKAATENVSVTTIERKQMSNKTNFKRIALAVVTALGFGVLASGPSNGAVQAGATLTISASTASITAGETATATLTATFTGIGGGTPTYDSMSLTYVRTTGTSNGGASIAFAGSAADTVSVIAYGAGTQSAWANGDTNSAVTAKFKFDFATPTTAGTYGYTFYPAFNNSSTAATPAPVSFTITVVAKDVKASSATSKAFINGGTYYTALPTADSSVVVAAGLASSPQAVAWISTDLRNAADTNTVTGTSVNESVTAVITGPGFISRGTDTTRLRAVTLLTRADTLTVWSDGTAGVATVTLSSTNMATWTSKSLTFSGAAATAALALPTGVTTTGVLASDSQSVLRVTPKDSAQNLVTSNVSMFVHSSDTRVVANSTNADSCTVSATVALGYGTCGVKIVDSGTTKIKLANFAFGTTAASLPTTQVVTNEVDLIISGNAASFTLSFDKRTYKPGEAAKVTVTVLDAANRPIGNQTLVSLFDTGGVTATPAITGATVETVTVAAATHGVGKFTYSVTMPTVAGEVVAVAKGYLALPTAGRVAVYDTVTVFDPSEEAANSALDAAQEATDAAIAATDAAILAQEAADEAASAAIAAQETAQAAVDAVTALSAEVTKLVAQLATLQKLLTRVAKKVGLKI